MEPIKKILTRPKPYWVLIVIIYFIKIAVRISYHKGIHARKRSYFQRATRRHIPEDKVFTVSSACDLFPVWLVLGTMLLGEYRRFHCLQSSACMLLSLATKTTWFVPLRYRPFCFHLTFRKAHLNAILQNNDSKAPFGRAIAQAVSRWLPIAAARFRSRVWSSGICGG
jgi:hypothetical protein